MMMHTRLKYFLVSFLFVTHHTMAEVNVDVSQNNASMNDHISLTFTYTGNNNAQPNFDLLNKDFSITRSSQSNQVSVYNGVVKRQKKWRLIVSPKHPGALTIPAITFANEKSDVQFINIKKQLASDPIKNNAPLFMTASTNSQSPYVQQQIIYTIKLFYRITLLASQFTAPPVNSAQLTPIGDAREYTSTVKGTPYHVYEQSFAVLPEKPGQFVIQSPVFNGAIQRRNIHDISQIMDDFQQAVQASAPEITLNVKAIPPEFTGKTWLPAKNISLSESWSDTKKTLKAGEPLTREITMTAKGLMSNQLPDIPFENIKGANVYPEPSKTKESLSDLNITGQKTFTITYIPTGEQNITLPAVSLSWWNLTTQKMETTTLKEHSFNVAQVIQPKAAKPQPKPNAKQRTILKPTQPIKKHQHMANSALPWMLVAILSLAMIAYFFKTRQALPLSAQKKPASSQSRKQLKKAFKYACMENQAQAANQSLIELLQHLFPTKTIRTLLDLQNKNKCNAFKKEVNALQKALYSTNQDWQGLPLWQAFLDFEEKIGTEPPPKKKNTLPPFN